MVLALCVVPVSGLGLLPYIDPSAPLARAGGNGDGGLRKARCVLPVLARRRLGEPHYRVPRPVVVTLPRRSVNEVTEDGGVGAGITLRGYLEKENDGPVQP